MDMHSIVSGAVCDFASYLTTVPEERDEHHVVCIKIGASHHPQRAMDLFLEWCKMRGLKTDDVMVNGWESYLNGSTWG